MQSQKNIGSTNLYDHRLYKQDSLFYCIYSHRPTKMYITAAPNLHQKRSNWALNILLLMIWCWCCTTKFALNSTIRRCSSGVIFLNMILNWHQIYCNFFKGPKNTFSAPLQKIGTKMPKCLVEGLGLTF